MNNQINLQTPEKFPGALTVTQLNEYVKRIIDGTPQLNNVYVKGEISNFKNHYSTGHYYFTLKDEGGNAAAQWTPANDFSYLIVSGEKVQPGQYTLWMGDTQLSYTGSTVAAFGGMRGGFSLPSRRNQTKKPPRLRRLAGRSIYLSMSSAALFMARKFS